MFSINNLDKYYGIQLGCFNQPAEGWYNTDITPHIFISKIPTMPNIMRRLKLIDEKRFQEHRRGIFKKIHYMNLSKRINLKDSTVNAFFASHVLEHLYILETKKLLSEIYRTLKKDGFVRFVLPDLNYGIKLFTNDEPTIFLEFLFENYTSNIVKNQHKWMFTPKYLIGLLKNIGFDKIWEMKFKESNYRHFIPLDNRPENSFYVEAQK